MVGRQEIDRPADDVFAYVSDFENNPRWQRGVRETIESMVGWLVRRSVRSDYVRLKRLLE